jgi:hypothetical protein
MIFDFLSKVFSGKWVGVGSMNGEFEDLSIDNKFELNGARSGSKRLEPRLQRQIGGSVRYNLVYCFER